MQDYDKSRWFEMLKQGHIEQVQQELQTFPPHMLISLVDSTPSRQTCIFYVIQLADESKGDQLLELLLKEGADAAFKDVLSQTALFYASRFGHNRQIEMLIQAGAEVNHRDTYGQTALYYAGREGYLDSIRLLIQLGADVNAVDNLGQTAIFYACRDGRLESARVLLETGANINQMDRSRNTPLTWARRSNNTELIEFLISKGAVDKAPKKSKEGDSKKREEKKRTEKKQKCQLMIVDEKGEKRVATSEELAEFERNYPDIAKYWKNPESLQELDSLSPEDIENIKPWEKPAKRLMNILWRTNHAWIFHEPVDPIKLNIPDYFDVVKKPMDFGTVKRKLNNNAYNNGEEFIQDLDLVFSNCMNYNPGDSDVGVMCNQVYSVYQTQLKQLDLEKYRVQANE